MIKVGDKVHHFMEMHKHGKVVDTIVESNSLLTTGGTSSSNVFMVVEYIENNKKIYRNIRLGDLMKVYD
jgi:hypothetical protein